MYVYQRFPALGVWLQQGYKYDANLQLVRPEANLGFSPGVRVRQKKPPQYVDAVLLLDGISKSLFDWFYAKKLYHGSLWFTAPVKRAGGIETLRVRIVGEPTSSLQGNDWKVTVRLELYE